jgi:hypothetical protein
MADTGRTFSQFHVVSMARRGRNPGRKPASKGRLTAIQKIRAKS